MRRFMLLTTSAAAIAAASSYAVAAGPDVFVSGAIGTMNFASDGGSYDYDASGLSLQGAASIAGNFTPELGAQGDVVLNYNKIDYSGYEEEYTTLDGAVHGFYRDSDKFLVGVIAQIGSTSDQYTGEPAYETSYSFLGVEGQAFLDNLTLYGQLGLVNASDDYDLEADGWFGTAELRYFITPNFKVAVHAGVSTLTATIDSEDYEHNNLVFGASAEYRLDDMPLSLFAKFDYTKTTYDFDKDYSESSTRLLVGLKFNLGTDTLLERDRSGASLKPVEADFAYYGYDNGNDK